MSRNTKHQGSPIFFVFGAEHIYPLPDLNRKRETITPFGQNALAPFGQFALLCHVTNRRIRTTPDAFFWASSAGSLFYTRSPHAHDTFGISETDARNAYGDGQRGPTCPWRPSGRLQTAGRGGARFDEMAGRGDECTRPPNWMEPSDRSLVNSEPSRTNLGEGIR